MPEYPINTSTQERLDNTFRYHRPNDSQQVRYLKLRGKFKELATFICESTPRSREQNIALTKLEEAVMFANAAIARHE